MNDGNGGTANATVTVTVRPVNDPPDARDDTLSVPKNSAAVEVTVLSNDAFAPDVGETLTVTATGPAANGTVAISTGGGSVTYRPNAAFVGADSFTYTISDGNGGSDTATVAVTVTPFDSLPVAVADALTVVEDTSGVAVVLTNDTGLADAPVTVTISTPPTKGTTTVLADNSVRYTPNPNAVGTDTFRYTVTDLDGDTATATVTVTITPVNDVPAGVADSATTDEDTAVKVAVLANDTGAGDLPIVLTVTVRPTHGTTTVEADKTITYQPNANYSGPDSFTYGLTDADGQATTAVVTITVTPVNDAPVAVGDSSAVAVGGTADVDVLANDTDVDGDTLTLAAVTTPPHGTATIVAGKARYVAAAGYTGADQFDYTVTDGTLTATATVVLGVGVDSDSDGLNDDEELTLGTNPQVADTDGDLISDGLEVKVTHTAPLDDDSDDDGLMDGNEDLNRNGLLDEGETDPHLADSDADGLLDGTEMGLARPQGDDTLSTVFVADLDPATKTNPRLADTDSGGLPDGEEDTNHNGKVDSGEKNPLLARDDKPASTDADGDGVPDATDNCPSVANATQADADNDGVGDLCEPTGCGCSSSTGLPLAAMLLGLWAARRRRQPARP